MKKFTLFIILILLSKGVYSQTATDFTANDCNGNSHNLFSELNSGKVIVLCWVMPCGACTGASLTTNNVVQSYQSSNPNTVFFYLCDDYANSICSSVNNWANGAGIPQSATSLRFSNASINMANYGSTGMPKIVVIGGASHTVFYNTNNTVNATSLQNAINAALSTTGIADPNSDAYVLSASPNPSSNTTELKFNLTESSNVKIELFNLEGQLVENIYSGKLLQGENKVQVDVSKFLSGMYLLKLSKGTKSEFINIIVSH
jgi:hypothetical protein